jgi:hypothetical protein
MFLGIYQYLQYEQFDTYGGQSFGGETLGKETTWKMPT